MLCERIAGVEIFWGVVVAMGVVRLLLTGDLGPHIVYGPHDGSLYVSRAYHLLRGEGLGPYDSYLLIKHPGISYWIAGARMLGMPVILSLNLAYVAAGIYFVGALRRMGFHALVLLGVYGVYLLNPVSFHYFFQNPFREPIGTFLLVFMLAAMLYLLEAVRSGGALGPHLFVFSLSFAVALVVREEDMLLWGLWGLFVLAAGYRLNVQRELRTRRGQVALALVVGVPLVVALAGNTAVRLHIARHYGRGLINDFGGGEFPKFIAALRSVESNGKSRFVSITQEAVQRVGAAVPSVAALVAKLPPPPPSDSPYGARYGVRGEWPNSHFMFWIKDSAYAAGLTPDLVSAQAYFRRARFDIERACAEGRLDCHPDGDGLFPRFQLNWLPIMAREALQGIRFMVWAPLGPLRGPAPPTLGLEHLSTENQVRLGHVYEVATLAPFDSLAQWGLATQSDQQLADQGWDRYQEVRLNLLYWLRYPDVAAHGGLGIRPHLTPEITAALREATSSLGLEPEATFAALPEAQRAAVEANELVEPEELAGGWRTRPLELYLALKYLLKHPQVAITLREGGPGAGQDPFGAYHHYKIYGRDEGRVWSRSPLWLEMPADLALKPYASVLASWRAHLPRLHALNSALLVLGFIALMARLLRWRKRQPDTLELVVVAFGLFCGLKVLAFAYLSVPMGTLDHRLYFSSYVALVLLASVLAFEGGLAALRRLARQPAERLVPDDP